MYKFFTFLLGLSAYIFAIVAMTAKSNSMTAADGHWFFLWGGASLMLLFLFGLSLWVTPSSAEKEAHDEKEDDDRAVAAH